MLARWRLFMLVALLPILSSLLLPAQAAYPPPPPVVITVHTTTIIISGSPSQSFNINVQSIDSQSYISYLSLQTSSPATTFRIKIFQINTIPPPTSSPNGKTLLVFDFNLDPLFEQNITQATFTVKVPLVELSEFSIQTGSVAIQRYVSTQWIPLVSTLNSTDSDFNYYVTVSSGLSLIAVTGVEAHGLPPLTVLSLTVTIVASSLLAFRLRGRSKRIP